MKLLLFFIFCFFMYSQIQLKVFHGSINKKNINKIENFERDVLTQVVKLWEKKSNNKINLEFIAVPFFPDFFNFINTSKNKDLALSMGSITITDERKINYDFSTPYLPVQQAILCLKTSQIDTNNITKSKIAYLPGTLHEKTAKILKKKFNYTIFPFKGIADINVALLNKSMDAYIGDYAEYLNDNHLKIVKELSIQPTSAYAILLDKSFKYKTELNSTLAYFVKSSQYYSLVRNYFGDEALVYFKKY